MNAILLAAGLLGWTQATLPTPPRTERWLDLSIDEAMRRAIEFNARLAADALVVESSAAGIDVAKAAFEPVAFANMRASDDTRPTATALAGAQKLNVNTLHFDTGIRQALPTGGSYTLSFNTDNTKTNNSFATLNPQTFSAFSLNFVQPLLRNAWTTYGKIPETQAENIHDQSSVQRQQGRQDVLRQVADAYWQVVFGNRDRD